MGKKLENQLQRQIILSGESIKTNFPNDYRLINEIWSDTKAMYDNCDVSNLDHLMDKIVGVYGNKTSLLGVGLKSKNDDWGIGGIFDPKKQEYHIKYVMNHSIKQRKSLDVFNNPKDLVKHFSFDELFFGDLSYGLFSYGELGGMFQNQVEFEDLRNNKITNNHFWGYVCYNGRKISRKAYVHDGVLFISRVVDTLSNPKLLSSIWRDYKSARRIEINKTKCQKIPNKD